MILIQAPFEPDLNTFANEGYAVLVVVQVYILKYVNVFSVDLAQELS